MKKLFFILFFTSTLFSQNPNRQYLSHILKNNILEIKVTDGSYLIKALSNQIIETSFIPKGQELNPNSHAVILNNTVKPKFNHNKKDLQFATEDCTVTIEKNPFKISYYHKYLLLFSEKMGYEKLPHTPLENVKGNIVYDSLETLSFNISPDEKLFGGGARALGMNRRGNRLALYNRAQYGYETRAELMNFCIPMVLSSKIYAIHFDNPAIGYLDLDSQKNNTLKYETISGRKTYQVIVGKTWENLIQNYTTLTGRQPIIPRWALGNFSSRFGYRNQDQTEGTIRKFEDAKLPVDAIILDLYWFGKTIKGTMGNLEWDKESFPEPQKMMSDFASKNIKTILITEPFILTTSSKWKEAVENNVLVTDGFGKPATWDFYFGNTSVVDIFKPEGKKWFWNIYKNLIQQGVGGIWGDLGEPEVFPAFAKTAAGSADEIHNIYGHEWAKLIFNGYQKDFPSQRPFILMRAGYSGSQRYGMLPWSGDVNRTWGGLQSQVEIALQMGMQGLAYMHSDLGGFAGDYYDNELYLRWLQYGVFTPIFRPHAQEEVASEIARKDIVTREKARLALNLRYQLLPYNYTLAYQNSISGKPLMKPLFFEEPLNENLLQEKKSYLWGDAFLIHPITEPSQRESVVYFPKNCNWFDFYSYKKYDAGSTQRVAVTETEIPTFVKAGSFIPMITTIKNTSDYSLSVFDVHYFYDTSVSASKGELYHDDGINPKAIEEEKYELITFESVKTKDGLTLKILNSPKKNYTPLQKTITLKIHNFKAKKATLRGNPLPIQHNKNSTFITISNNGIEPIILNLE